MLVVSSLSRAGNYDEPMLVCAACGRQQEPDFGMLEESVENEECPEGCRAYSGEYCDSHGTADSCDWISRHWPEMDLDG